LSLSMIEAILVFPEYLKFNTFIQAGSYTTIEIIVLHNDVYQGLQPCKSINKVVYVVY
jgi:hypothetical protein